MKPEAKKLSVAFLYDDTLDNNDGVTQYVKRLGSWMSTQGHDVTYLVGESETTYWAGGDVVSLSKNLKVSWGGNKLSVPIYPKSSDIRILMRSKHFDVIHVQIPYSPLMSQLVINRVSSDTALIGTVHVFTEKSLSLVGSKILKKIYGKSLKRFDKLLSVSPAAAEYALNGLGLNTAISPNVVDVSSFRKAKAINKGKRKKIVFLGRLVERKGCMQLLKAFELIHKIHPEVLLVIAGDGPQREKLENFAKKRGLSDSVNFLGYIDEKNKPKLLSGATVACFPALHGESFGIVLIEAMAAGAEAVLGGDNPGYRTVLGRQPDLLIDPNLTEQFAERLGKLIQDNKRREKIHMWQESAVNRYNIDSVGPQVLDIYRQAIASRNKSSHN